MTKLGIAPLPIWMEWLPATHGHNICSVVTRAAQAEVEGKSPSPASETRDADALAFRLDHWQGTAADPRIAYTARLITSWLVGTGLVSTVFLWLLKRRGLLWATCGGMLIANSPHVITHSALATTDGLTSLCWLVCLAVYGFACSQSPSRQPISLKRVALAGGACGVAISAKYSSVILVIVWLLLMILRFIEFRSMTASDEFSGSRARRIGSGTARCILFCAAAFLVTWLMHGGEFAKISTAFGASRPVAWLADVSLPTPIAAVLAQHSHNERGHTAMLFGEVRLHGWWYYFPAIIYLKSTPAELLLWCIAMLLAAFRLLRRIAQVLSSNSPRTPLPIDFTLTIWGITALAATCFLMTIRVQIGYRYAFPLLPIVVLLCVDWLAKTAGSTRTMRYKVSLSSVLLVVQCHQAFYSGPNYLAYATPFIGGAQNAHQYMADSNVDWGQDLPKLKTTLDSLEAPLHRVALSYFGSAKPTAYGIDARLLGRLQEFDATAFDYLAISTNHLYGISATGTPVDTKFGRLREVAPIARAGASIMVYSAAQVQEVIDAAPID
jgi:hypothetical protein